MKKASNKNGNRVMRREYDFSKGALGKYSQRYADGSNVIVLPPDLAEAFPTAEAVHEALRDVISLAEKVRTKPLRKRTPKR
jgi:hypothetical protein